ncbi:2'-5' RNA ligase family protein [Kineosporia sp. J2-2]|uniref:2'-5' RNA ligase family protein n=1 Tax=Kineosporia corallincola TaxID=2835133 RepID=A0ABS5T963_9ACTN|nr:2'-5' RNA ligase family protein [Kineosporia corallincola]MBT0767607.1 2'-5' RNA ligase family protein [Kineosporia corallincola]
MTQSLELLLDDPLDAAVRAQWAALSAAGLPSQDRHQGETNAPHVTLAVAGAVPEATETALHALAGRLPVAIGLGGLLCFGRRDGRQILVRSVVVNAALLEIQAEAARLYAGLPGTDERLAPGRWSPHVTLGHGFRPDQVAAAIEALGPVAEPHGQAVSVRRWDSVARHAWLLGHN